MHRGELLTETTEAGDVIPIEDRRDLLQLLDMLQLQAAQDAIEGQDRFRLTDLRPYVDEQLLQTADQIAPFGQGQHQALVDQVVFLEEGSVAAVGPHMELLETVPRYAEVLARAEDSAVAPEAPA